MRRLLGELLLKEMLLNQDIYVLTADLGYGMWDKHFKNYPERVVNTGAAEQAMLGMAVGLAHAGKIPFCYTITSFYLRAAETINLYLSQEQAPVKLLGSGRGDDYKHDGISHNGTAAEEFLKSQDIYTYFPKDKEEIQDILKDMLTNNKPSFLSLRR